MHNMKTRTGVVLLEIKDTFLLVSDREARKHCRYVQEINDAGAVIWQGISEGRSENEIIDGIMSAYDITDRTTVQRDINAFAGKLREAGYLEDSDEV